MHDALIPLVEARWLDEAPTSAAEVRRRMLRSQTSKAWIELRNAIAAQARSPAEVYVYLLVGELKRLKGRLEPLPGAKLI